VLASEFSAAGITVEAFFHKVGTVRLVESFWAQDGIFSTWKQTGLQGALPSFRHCAGVVIAIHNSDYWRTADGREEEKSFHRLEQQMSIRNSFLVSP
jgi:hypothetical protein